MTIAAEIICSFCKRRPADIPDYAEAARADDMTPEQFARCDGTFNPRTNRFACDECYVKVGAPTAPGGWKAP